MGRRARTTSLRRLRGASAVAMAVAIVVLCLACAPMASAAGAGAGTKRTFPDVNASTPHAEDIAWLAETGISTGFPDGTFRGGDAVTRQDMAAFLRRLARLMGDESAAEDKAYTCSFKDVTDATPHADDIAWLAETGISTGYPDNTFRGMAAVCRQDMAAFLRRLAAREGVGGAKGWDGEPGGFPDVGATADHAADIAWLAATGVSTGYPDGTFRGMAAVARQDMAAFLHRLNKLPQDGPGEPPSYAEWAARMVNALENDDPSPDVSDENLSDAWNEAKRIGIVPFDVEDRDAVATRDFALCCAALTCGFTDEGIESDAPDASASQHPALIDAAIKAGIGEADPDGKVRPDDAITGSEADAAEARVQELHATPATSEPMSSWKPAPGVEEIADAVADGERYIIPVPASEIKAGDKVILAPSAAMPLGAAGTVQSVEDAGAGNARIAIKQATSLDEVFDEVHVEAMNVPLELGVAARAAGLDERSNERITSEREIPFSYHPIEEVSIDGKVTVSATLKVDWKRGLPPSRVTAVISPGASLKVQAMLDHEFEGVEVSLLPEDFPVPIATTGAAVQFNASLKPKLSGSFSASTSARFSAGIDYFEGHIRAVRDANIDMPELEGEFSFDLGPNVSFAICRIDIASIQPKITPGIWGHMDLRETGMVCSDVAAYVGMGLTGKLDVLDFISAIVDNTFDFVQIGREETPLKWDLHWEDGHLVPECTYLPGGKPENNKENEAAHAAFGRVLDDYRQLFAQYANAIASAGQSGIMLPNDRPLAWTGDYSFSPSVKGVKYAYVDLNNDEIDELVITLDDARFVDDVHDANIVLCAFGYSDGSIVRFAESIVRGSYWLNKAGTIGRYGSGGFDTGAITIQRWDGRKLKVDSSMNWTYANPEDRGDPTSPYQLKTLKDGKEQQEIVTYKECVKRVDAFLAKHRDYAKVEWKALNA